MEIPIDLRSDTVTRPSAPMREAMARAEVGDDVYGEDPTVNRLQEFVAERLGKEAALYVPSGTMANHLAARTHCEHGDEVIIDAGGHSYNFETGGTAALAGVQVRPIQTERGIFTPEQVVESMRPPADHFPRTRMVCIENTHNYGGGTVWSLDEVRAVAGTAHENDLVVHLDGARLFNAEVASGTAAAGYAACVDSVSVCLSKGLGAPVGSVVAGTRAFVARAHRFRKMFGGGMRQAGVLAAAGLYALENNVERLAEDHAHAERLAKGIGAAPPPSNMVFFDSKPGLVEHLAKQGVIVLPAPRLRLVTHLDVDRAGIDRAIEAFRSFRV